MMGSHPWAIPLAYPKPMFRLQNKELHSCNERGTKPWHPMNCQDKWWPPEWTRSFNPSKKETKCGLIQRI
jgi:hypothetical protein